MSLPSGYKRLEYIQSSGAQYIDTGIIGSYDTRVTADFEVLSIGSGTVFVFGSQANNNVRFCLGITSASVFRSDYGTEYISGPSAATGTKYTADKNRNVCTINGTAINSNAQTFTGTTNIYLFARSYSSLSYANLKMYGCKIYSNDVLVRDFIPCKNASGVAGMWDDVNSVFYGNAGSGTFTAGLEIKGAHKVLIDGTLYDAKGGRPLIGGTGYSLKKGRTLIAGTGYDVSFLKKVFHITYSINEGYYNVNRIIYNGEYLKGNGELYLEDGESIDLYVERASGYQGEVNLWVNLNGTRVASYSTESSITYRFTPTSNCNIIGSNGNYVNTAVWDITTQ